jgi:hypothetical protein
MAWRSEYCYEPRVSRRHRAKYVSLDPQRFVVRQKEPAGQPHLGLAEVAEPTPTRRNRCCGLRPTRSRNDLAIRVTSSHEAGGEPGVWLQVRILKSLVFDFGTTVNPKPAGPGHESYRCLRQERIIKARDSAMLAT